MATTEKDVLLSNIDEAGDVHLLYPVTKVKNVIGGADVDTYTTTLTAAEFEALTTAELAALHESGVRQILVEASDGGEGEPLYLRVDVEMSLTDAQKVLARESIGALAVNGVAADSQMLDGKEASAYMTKAEAAGEIIPITQDMVTNAELLEIGNSYYIVRNGLCFATISGLLVAQGAACAVFGLPASVGRVHGIANANNSDGYSVLFYSARNEPDVYLQSMPVNAECTLFISLVYPVKQ